MLPVILSSLLLISNIACVPIHPRAKNATCDAIDLVKSLREALTAGDRTKLLAACGTKAFVFDYNNPPVNAITKTPGSTTISAHEETFPSLSGIPQTLNMITLSPCGMLKPHTHPRSHEFVFVIEGNLTTQFIPESSSIVVTNVLPPNTATVFPQGVIHANFNPTCSEVKFITSFASSDSGISQTRNFFLFNDDLVLGTLGGEKVISEDELTKIRADSDAKGAIQSEECLNRCGLKARTN